MKRARADDATQAEGGNAKKPRPSAPTDAFFQHYVRTNGVTLTPVEELPAKRIDFDLTVPAKSMHLKVTYGGSETIARGEGEQLVMAVREKFAKAHRERALHTVAVEEIDVLERLSKQEPGKDNTKIMERYVLRAGDAIAGYLAAPVPVSTGTTRQVDVIIVCNQGRERSFFLMGLLYLAIDVALTTRPDRTKMVSGLMQRIKNEMPESTSIQTIETNLGQFALKFSLAEREAESTSGSVPSQAPAVSLAGHETGEGGDEDGEEGGGSPSKGRTWDFKVYTHPPPARRDREIAAAMASYDARTLARLLPTELEMARVVKSASRHSNDTDLKHICQTLCKLLGHYHTDTLTRKIPRWASLLAIWPTPRAESLETVVSIVEAIPIVYAVWRGVLFANLSHQLVLPPRIIELVSYALLPFDRSFSGDMNATMGDSDSAFYPFANPMKAFDYYRGPRAPAEVGEARGAVTVAYERVWQRTQSSSPVSLFDGFEDSDAMDISGWPDLEDATSSWPNVDASERLMFTFGGMHTFIDAASLSASSRWWDRDESASRMDNAEKQFIADQFNAVGIAPEGMQTLVTPPLLFHETTTGRPGMVGRLVAYAREVDVEGGAADEKAMAVDMQIIAHTISLPVVTRAGGILSKSPDFVDMNIMSFILAETIEAPTFRDEMAASAHLADNLRATAHLADNLRAVQKASI